MKTSAGILFYLRNPNRVLLVHTSGFWNKNQPWSIPKGEFKIKPPLETGVEGGGKRFETPEQAAIRECTEEVGVFANETDLIPLGTIQYVKSKKMIWGFGCPMPAGAKPGVTSWEINKAEIVTIEEARKLLITPQQAFLDRLETLWKM